MTDIVARIEAHLQNDNAAERHWNCDNLLEEAQARIVELDGFIRTIEEQATALEKENALLNKEVKKATLYLNEVTAEMADARMEIREMNGRISRLRVEAGYD